MILLLILLFSGSILPMSTMDNDNTRTIAIENNAFLPDGRYRFNNANIETRNPSREEVRNRRLEFFANVPDVYNHINTEEAVSQEEQPTSSRSRVSGPPLPPPSVFASSSTPQALGEVQQSVREAGIDERYIVPSIGSEVVGLSLRDELGGPREVAAYWVDRFRFELALENDTQVLLYFLPQQGARGYTLDYLTLDEINYLSDEIEYYFDSGNVREAPQSMYRQIDTCSVEYSWRTMWL